MSADHIEEKASYIEIGFAKKGVHSEGGECVEGGLRREQCMDGGCTEDGLHRGGFRRGTQLGDLHNSGNSVDIIMGWSTGRQYPYPGTAFERIRHKVGGFRSKTRVFVFLPACMRARASVC